MAQRRYDQVSRKIIGAVVKQLLIALRTMARDLQEAPKQSSLAAMRTPHPEAAPHVHRTLQFIRACGKKPGVVLNPGTPIEAIENLLDLVDLVLIMTVNPGFGGQEFIHSQLKKIETAAERIARSGRAIDLEVDGGITPETAKRAVNAGATILVAGTSVFKGGPSAYAANIAALRR